MNLFKRNRKYINIVLLGLTAIMTSGLV